MKMFNWLFPRSPPLKLPTTSGLCKFKAAAYGGVLCIRGEPVEVQKGVRLSSEVTRELAKNSCPRDCIAIPDEWSRMSDFEQETWPPELRRLPFEAQLEPAKVARAIRKWYPDDAGLLQLATWLEARAARRDKVKFCLESELERMGCPVAFVEDHNHYGHQDVQLHG